MKPTQSKISLKMLKHAKQSSSLFSNCVPKRKKHLIETETYRKYN